MSPESEKPSSVALYHEKIKNQRKDFQHKLSHSLAEDYDAVCVEDLNLKGIAGGLHFGKGIQDNGHTCANVETRWTGM